MVGGNLQFLADGAYLNKEVQPMDQHEFTAVQTTVLVRTTTGNGQPVQEFFNSTGFQYALQDALGKLIKAQLKQAEIDFEEVIISLDNPAEKAKRVRSKSSVMERLFGKS